MPWTKYELVQESHAPPDDAVITDIPEIGAQCASWVRDTRFPSLQERIENKDCED